MSLSPNPLGVEQQVLQEVGVHAAAVAVVLAGQPGLAADVQVAVAVDVPDRRPGVDGGPDVVPLPRPGRVVRDLVPADMARTGRIPRSCIVAGTGDNRLWKFYRTKIEEWLTGR